MSDILRAERGDAHLEQARGGPAHPPGRWEFLARASSVLASSLDLEETLRAIARLAVPVMADWCVLYLVEDDGSIRRVAIEHADPARAGIAETVVAEHRIDPSAEGGVPWVVRTGIPLIRPDASAAMLAQDVEDPRELERTLGPLGITSWICVPLTARERVVGALSLVSTSPARRYDASDVGFAEELAARAALAVDSARLFEATKAASRSAERAAGLMERLQRTTAALSGAWGDGDAVGVVLEQALHGVGASAGSVCVPTTDGGALRILGSRGYPDDLLERFERMSLDTSIPIVEAFREGTPVFIGSVEERDRAYPSLRGVGEGRAFAALPLRSRESVIGVLGLSFPEEVPLDDPARAFLIAIAEQCAQAIERARLYEAQAGARRSAERSRDFMTRLQRVTGALSGAVTPEGIGDVVLRAAMRGLEAKRGMIAVARPDGLLEGLRWVGYPPGVIERWGTFALDANLPLAEAARTGRLIVLASDEEWRRRYPLLLDERTDDASVVCVPLFGESGPVGAMALSLAPERAFPDEELLFLRALGEQTGMALERARLYEAERMARVDSERRRDQLAFLAEASHLLSSSLDYEATLQRVAELAVPRLADWCAVSLVEEDGSLRALAVAHTDPARADLVRAMQERYPVDPDAPRGAPAVVRTGRPELYPNIFDELLVEVARDTEHLKVLRELGFRSAMVVPLRARDAILGTITLIQGGSGRRYGEEDLDFATELAARAAQAVDNARLFRETQEAEAELRWRQAVLASHMEAMTEGTLIILQDGRMGGYNRRFGEMWGVPDEVLARGDREAALRIAVAQLADPDAFLSLRSHLYEHPDESRTAELALTDGRTFESWSAPLRGIDGAIYGRAWYFREITERKRTERSLAEGHRRAQFLSEASAALASSLDPRDFLPAVARAAADWAADRCAIDLLHPDASVERVAIASAEGRPPSVHLDTAMRRVPLDRDATYGVHKVIASGRAEYGSTIDPAWLESEAGPDAVYAGFLSSLGLRSYLCVPMVTTRGRTVGSITLVTEERSGRTFEPADLAVAEELGVRAGSALENARLYQERTEMARTLQQSLLPPQLPDIDGAELAVAYVAAGEAYEVGGDFYDVFATAGDEWAILVGDVCGKGPEAAATTALARHTLRAAAMVSRKPARVLGTLNEAMLRAESQFCTVAYGRLQRVSEGARVTIACGGHPAPAVVRASGEVGLAGEPGLLIGSFPEAQLTEVTVDLRRGDTLVLYTDGILEARSSSGAVFGEERMIASLRARAGEDAASMTRGLKDAALRWQDGEPRDDIAVLAVRVT